MDQDLLFRPYEFDDRQKAELDRDGYAVLPSLLTPQACERLTVSLAHIQELEASPGLDPNPHFYSAEYDPYLARRALGDRLCLSEPGRHVVRTLHHRGVRAHGRRRD